MTQMEVFKYEPLDLNEPSIRLLRLLKDQDSDIECEIFHAWLDNDRAISYEALSYTWGGTGMTSSIKLNGRKFGVTDNLYLALQYLCLKNTDRILWIDAICINQGDKKERGHQVQQMGNIYTHANQVLFWLGSATDETNVLMGSLKRLEEESIKYACQDWKLEDKRWADLWLSVQPTLKTQNWNLAARQHAGLELLLRRPWFKRVWILQEVANAKRAVVCSGTYSVSARIFAIAPLLLTTNLEPHCQAVLDIMPGPSRKDSWWSQQRDLQTLLLKFSKSEATDPRDMIYALLDISSDVCGSEILVPNYQLPIEKVIHSALAFFLDIRGWTGSMPDFPPWTLQEFLENLRSLDNKAFDWAIENGREEVVKPLLSVVKVGVNLKGRNWVEPLCRAAENGHESVVKLLLDTSESNINTKNQNLETPLRRAAENGHEAVVKLLIGTGRVAVDARDYEHGQTPLWKAAANGHEAVVKLLLDTGKVKLDWEDNTREETPLSVAARSGYEAVVKLLLDTGKVDVNLKDKDGRTPLWRAAENGHEAVVKLLLNTRKIDVNVDAKNRKSLQKSIWKIRLHRRWEVKQSLDTSQIYLNTKDRNEETPLWKAAANGHAAVVKLLLNTGEVDISSKDRNGRTPLWMAAGKGYEAVFKLLLDTDEVDVDSNDMSGRTPLWMAAGNGHEAIAKQLLATGKVDVNSKNMHLETPLWIAADNGHEAAVKLLLNTNSIDVDSKDKHRRTPLSRAAENGHEAVVKLLLDTGKIDIDFKNGNERTPLWRAADNGHEAVVKLLLDTGEVDVNSKDKSGRTPLCMAAAKRHEAIVKLLLSTGKVDELLLDTDEGSMEVERI